MGPDPSTDVGPDSYGRFLRVIRNWSPQVERGYKSVRFPDSDKMKFPFPINTGTNQEFVGMGLEIIEFSAAS
jgi:hypothetical protein